MMPVSAGTSALAAETEPAAANPDQPHTTDRPAIAAAAGSVAIPKPELLEHGAAEAEGAPCDDPHEPSEAAQDSAKEGETAASAENSEERPGATDSGIDGPPPPGDTPPTAENPDEPDPGKRAYEAFEAQVPTLPTVSEIRQARDKETSVEWMGYWNEKSPIGPVFGAEKKPHRIESDDMESDSGIFGEALPRISPNRPDEIIDRQFANFNGTLTEVHKGAEATADLADLTAQHTGRVLVGTQEQGNSNFPGPRLAIMGRFTITATGGSELEVEERTPPTDDTHEHLRYDAPNGEIHLVRHDAAHRYRARAEGGRLMTAHDDIYQVEPSDPEFFDGLNQDLSKYQELLLQAAEHAGFSRDQIIDQETGTINTDYVVGTVNPVTNSPNFQDSLPLQLRTELLQYCNGIARRVNTLYAADGSLTQRSFRLGSYFKEVLGHRES
jgi:hypothetical protein